MTRYHTNFCLDDIMENNMQRVSLGLMIGIMALSTIEVQAFPFPNKKEAVWMTVGIGLCALVAFPLHYYRNGTYNRTIRRMACNIAEISQVIAKELDEPGKDDSHHKGYLAALSKRAGGEVKRVYAAKTDTKSNEIVPFFPFQTTKEGRDYAVHPVLVMKAYWDIGGTFKNDEVNKELV